jgi:transcription elongation GreA/GreB family factor
MASVSFKNVKEDLYKLCQDYLAQRIETAQQAIAAAQEGADTETKSSSGDKYETGRTMMQLEVEKNTMQLAESLKLKHALDQINPQNYSGSVQAGSLVVTNEGTFFIAISIGKVTLHNETYLILSPASPLGLRLMGLKVNDSFTFQDRRYELKEIL